MDDLPKKRKSKKKVKKKVGLTNGTIRTYRCNEKKANGTPGKRINHLIPYNWKPGQSGNIKGGPQKTKHITPYMRAQLDCYASSVDSIALRALFLGMDPNEVTIGEVVATTMIISALRGEAPYMKEVLNRTEGKVAEELRVTASAEEMVQEFRDAMDAVEEQVEGEE